MSIISAINREPAIVQNIADTLRQLKQGGKVNAPLVVDGISSGVTEVEFYVDADRTQLLFADSSEDNPDRFTANGTRTLYTPPDELMNFSQGLSQQYSQPLYYATTFLYDEDDPYTSGPSVDSVYRNVDNLLFQSVIVTTKAGAKFSTNDNTCMIYPRLGTQEVIQASDDYSFVLFDCDLYLQLLVFNYTDLSEQERWEAAQNVGNLIRNALYQDRYRGGNCTFHDKDVDGTFVGQIHQLVSIDILKAKLTVKCAYLTTSQTY